MHPDTPFRTVDLTYEDVEQADSPLGPLRLRRYLSADGQVGYEIHLNDVFLMATHGHSSESAMAELAYERLDGKREDLRVLVGGLGAGYTLKAALELPGVARVTVAEISPAVVDWNRRFFADYNGGVVDDPRAEVVVQDLADHIRDNEGAYDLALLDVDNGPGWLASEVNDRLYDRVGLERTKRVVRPGGVVAVWSPMPNPPFWALFGRVFDEPESVDTTPQGRRVNEPGDTIYLGRRR
ncbi:spermidine synthase [bacterium]|nr:spermidine synthase [bacterium]